MSIINENAKELQAVAKGMALHILGGESGQDYSAWAEDIAQDTMVDLLEYEDKGKITNKYDAFAMARLCAKHLSISFKKGEGRRREIENEFGGSINRNLTGQSAELLAADPYEILAYEEMRDRLDELSPLLYATVELHYMKGLDVSAIAEMQDVTEDVIRKRLQRAREFVRSEEHTEERSTRPSMEDIEQQVRDNFTARDAAYLRRRTRHEYPAATLTEWSTMYG